MTTTDPSLSVERLLVRATVDLDYDPSLWLGAWFRKPVVGGIQKSNALFFTTLLHFLNVSVPGTFWEHDGYAFRHTDGRNNDGLMDLPGIWVEGDFSNALGGLHSPYAQHGAELGVYNRRFKGSPQDWKQLFFDHNGATESVFPPADVAAELAYEAVMKSPLANHSQVEFWALEIPLASGLASTKYLKRNYWRGEIDGFPKAFDRVGWMLHLAQDLSVPHHTLGTADYCHAELEQWIDQLTCGETAIIPAHRFDDGSFDSGESVSCQNLYDAKLIETLLRDTLALSPDVRMGVPERLHQLAHLTSRWKWENPDQSVEFLSTRLPSGERYVGDQCDEFWTIPAVRDQAKFQYNLAAATTIAFFEMMARDFYRLGTTDL